MAPSWVFNTIKTQKLQITDFVIANATGSGAANAMNPFKLDNSFISTSDDPYPIFYINLKYPIYASKYKLYIKKGTRYMMNWEFEGSRIKGIYKPLHTGYKLCDTQVVNPSCANDCGSYTIKNFTFRSGIYKYFRLRMTSENSCSSNYMVLHGFDLYGTFKFSQSVIKGKHSIHFYLLILLFIIVRI